MDNINTSEECPKWYFRSDNDPMSLKEEGAEWKEYEISELIENAYQDYLFYLNKNEDVNDFKVYDSSDIPYFIDFENSLQILKEDNLKHRKIGRFFGDPKKSKNTLGQKTDIVVELTRKAGMIVEGAAKNIKSSFLLDGNQAFIEYIFLDTVFDLTKKSNDNNESKDDLLFYSILFINTYENDKIKQKEELKLFMKDIYSGKIKNNCTIWYTKENFVYRMVNTVLRKQDFIEIFWIRFYISLLRNNLKELSQYNTDKVLYRGTIIPKKEFVVMMEKLGKPFLLNGFVSTSGKIEIAQKFIKKERNEEFENVLFVFECEETDRSKYSCIKNLSKFPHEEENLINMNNFFKITKIENITTDDKSYTQIFLKFSDLDELKKTVKKETLDQQVHIKKLLDLNLSNESFYLAEILGLLHKGDEIIRLLQTFKSDKEIENAYMNDYYGEAYLLKSEFDKAIDYHMKALNTKIALLGENHSSTAHTYHNLAVCYSEKGLNDKAMEFNSKGLEIRIKILGKYHEDTSDSYLMKGILLHETNQCSEEAINNILEAIEIKKEKFGINHHELAHCYKHLASIYYSIDEIDLAFEYDNKSLKIIEASYGVNHPETGECYSNIGMNYITKGKFDRAQEFITKGLNIRLQCFSENDPEIAKSYTYLGQLYFEKGNKPEALKYYNLAFNIRKHKFGLDSPLTIEIKNEISKINDDNENDNKDDYEEEEIEDLENY